MNKIDEPSSMLDKVALTVIIAAALQWGLGRLFGFDLVRSVRKRSKPAQRVAYSALALSSLWWVLRLVSNIGALAPTRPAQIERPEEKPFYPVARTIVDMKLPRMQGETLSWKRITLPDGVRGKVAFLVLGFTYSARWEVEAWTRAFRERYGDRDDVTYFQIPMIQRFARLARHYIELGMQHQTPTDMWDHVLTVFGSTGALRRALGVTPSRDVWVYLINRSGVVRFQCAGKYDPVLFEELAAATDNALTGRPIPRVEMAE